MRHLRITANAALTALRGANQDWLAWFRPAAALAKEEPLAYSRADKFLARAREALAIAKRTNLLRNDGLERVTTVRAALPEGRDPATPSVVVCEQCVARNAASTDRGDAMQTWLERLKPAGRLAAEAPLAGRRAAELFAQSRCALPVAVQNNWPLSIGLDRLTLARASLAEGRAATQALKAAKAALNALRNANTEHFLPPALLAAAEAHRAAGDEAASEDALREADDIATRGPMPLYLADLALLRGRFALEAGRAEDAGAQRDRAADLIDKHHYGLARAELALLSAEINPTPENLDSAAAEILGDVAID